MFGQDMRLVVAMPVMVKLIFFIGSVSSTQYFTRHEAQNNGRLPHFLFAQFFRNNFDLFLFALYTRCPSALGQAHSFPLENILPD